MTCSFLRASLIAARKSLGSAVIPAHAGIQYSRVLGLSVTSHQRSGILGRPVEPGDDSVGCLWHCSSFAGPSVIAARKSLHVSGRFGGPRSRERRGRRNAERRTLVLGRGLFPGSP